MESNNVTSKHTARITDCCDTDDGDTDSVVNFSLAE